VPPPPRDALAGLKVLVIEDSLLFAEILCDLLSDQGCEVVGPVGRLAPGLKLVEDGTPVDCAVLDVNLDGEMSFPIAAALAARAVPFVFLTGYDDGKIFPDEFADAKRLGKPLDEDALLLALADFVRH
jgi:CheY-like chemotaxis protein